MNIHFGTLFANVSGMHVTSRRRNDCTVVALANYFGLSYEQVDSDLNTIGNGGESRGHRNNSTLAVLRQYLGRDVIQEKIRRNNPNVTGLVSVHYPGRRWGHLIAVIDNFVFDSSEIGTRTLEDYCKQTGQCVKFLWR